MITRAWREVEGAELGGGREGGTLAAGHAWKAVALTVGVSWAVVLTLIFYVCLIVTGCGTYHGFIGVTVSLLKVQWGANTPVAL